VGSERTITNVAAGRVNAGSTDAVNGSQLHATNEAVEDLGSKVAGATLTVANAVKYDTDAAGNRINSLTLQGGDASAPVVLSNVASGTKDTDAVNVKQMNDNAKQTLTTAKDYTDIRSQETLVNARSYTDERAASTLSDAKSYTDTQFGRLSSEIGDVRKEARQAAAIGLAAASLRYDDRPGTLSAAIGGGVWRGEGAAAFGVGYTSQDQRVRANLSATISDGDWGVGAGLSFVLN
jgi:autotransporter adhesin